MTGLFTIGQFTFALGILLQVVLFILGLLGIYCLMLLIKALKKYLNS